MTTKFQFTAMYNKKIPIDISCGFPPEDGGDSKGEGREIE